jgi:hypothetical protein
MFNSKFFIAAIILWALTHQATAQALTATTVIARTHIVTIQFGGRDAASIYRNLGTPESETKCGSIFNDGDSSCNSGKQIERLSCASYFVRGQSSTAPDATFECRLKTEYKSQPIMIGYQSKEVSTLVAKLSQGTGKWFSQDGNFDFACSGQNCAVYPRSINNFWANENAIIFYSQDNYKGMAAQLVGHQAHDVFTLLNTPVSEGRKTVGIYGSELYLSCSESDCTVNVHLPLQTEMRNAKPTQFKAILNQDISNKLYSGIIPTNGGRTLAFGDRYQTFQFLIKCQSPRICELTGTEVGK